MSSTAGRIVGAAVFATRIGCQLSRESAGKPNSVPRFVSKAFDPSTWFRSSRQPAESSCKGPARTKFEPIAVDAAPPAGKLSAVAKLGTESVPGALRTCTQLRSGVFTNPTPISSTRRTSGPPAAEPRIAD